MVVLVPFLLITAVFSRIAIVELNLPSSAGGAAVSEPTFRVEVIVRERGLEVTNGSVPIAAIPKVKGEYDLERLSQLVMSLKRDHPDTNDASVLLEPYIEYDYLIQVMDVVRSAELPAKEGEDQPRRVTLFTDIAIGEAP
jgi:biopolymer transport protein ExbD